MEFPQQDDRLKQQHQTLFGQLRGRSEMMIRSMMDVVIQKHVLDIRKTVLIQKHAKPSVLF